MGGSIGHPLSGSPTVPTRRGDRKMTKTALLVEDNALNRALFTEVLAHAGFVIVADATGAGAQALARRYRPAVALVDVGLPDNSGLDVVRRLRADPATAAISVIVVSAFARTEDWMAAYDAGADLYLTKPVDMHRLQVVLDTLPGDAARAAVA